LLGPGVGAVSAISFSLKFVSAANDVPRLMLSVQVKSTIVVLPEVLAAPFSGRLIGFHFLDLDVATEIASSASSSASDDSLKSVFRALAMASARLSDFDPDSESFGLD
jgi:hypothetical protein